MGAKGVERWARRVSNVGLWREFAARRRNKSTFDGKDLKDEPHRPFRVRDIAELAGRVHRQSQ